MSSDGVTDHLVDLKPLRELEHLGDDSRVQFQVLKHGFPREETQGKVTGLQVFGEPEGRGGRRVEGGGGEGGGGEEGERDINALSYPGLPTPALTSQSVEETGAIEVWFV